MARSISWNLGCGKPKPALFFSVRESLPVEIWIENPKAFDRTEQEATSQKPAHDSDRTDSAAKPR
jgi:hypothetical protein